LLQSSLLSAKTAAQLSRICLATELSGTHGSTIDYLHEARYPLGDRCGNDCSAASSPIGIGQPPASTPPAPRGV
jgi:hypothetical protein